MPVTMHTIGHSNRSFEVFAAILKAHGIARVADVRTLPRSRHNPHFNAEALQAALPKIGIAYVRLPALGGLRHPRPDSRNTAWRNDRFRGYADYMETAPFEDGLDDLLALAGELPTAILCAEALWWRCHRSLIADALSSRGVAVVHLIDERRSDPHHLTRFARIEDGRVTYPASQLPLPGGEKTAGAGEDDDDEG
jgi:uncharacterized protein (DUF488 family)